jgi:hypothetical protein
MKKTSKTVDIPILEEVVVPGNSDFSTEAEDDDAPLRFTAEQQLSLEQQIENIVQARLQAVLNKAIQAAVKDIKVYLAKELPQILAAKQQSDKEES